MSKEKVEKFISTVFCNYCEEYKNVFSVFEPWAKYKHVPKSKSGDEFRFSIHECNQVVKFQSVYKGGSDGVLTWVEFPIRYNEDKNKQDDTIHVDGIIVDRNRKEIYFIEAKRLTKKQGFDYVANDIKRMMRHGKNHDLKLRPKAEYEFDGNYTFYCLILADFWREHNTIGKTYKTDKKSDGVIDWKEKVLPYIMGKVAKNPEKETRSQLKLIDKNIVDIKDNDYHLAYALFELPDFKLKPALV